MRIRQGTVLLQEGSQPNEVFFLLHGCILKESRALQELGRKPSYFIEGAMFGEKDILQCKMSTETYTAVCDCYLLSVTRSQFQILLEEFEDFKMEVLAIAREREKIRIRENLSITKTEEGFFKEVEMEQNEYVVFNELISIVHQEIKQEQTEDVALHKEMRAEKITVNKARKR